MGDISIKGRSPILRQGYAVGGAVKGGAKVAKKILDFVKTGKYIDKHGTKINVPKVVKRLKKQGSPHLETYEESMKAEGGRIGKATGGALKAGKALAKKFKKKKVYPETEDLTHQVGPYIGDVGSERPGIKRRPWGKDQLEKLREKRLRKGREPYDTDPEPKGFKKGGKADKKWIQKATASIKKRGTKGKCTPITKPGCTGRAKALAKTFKKMAKKRKAA